MTVTTQADVEAALVRSLTADELTHVDRIIELVEAEVLGRLPGYDLAPASEETIMLSGSYDGTLTLPSYPVTDVASVSVDGVALSSAGWDWTARGYLTRVYGGLAFDGPDPVGSWATPASTVSVTYTHGQGAAGSALVLVIAEAVASRLSGAGREGIVAMSIDTYSERYQTSEVKATAGAVDPKRLAPFRRSAMGSVTLTY